MHLLALLAVVAPVVIGVLAMRSRRLVWEADGTALPIELRHQGLSLNHFTKATLRFWAPRDIIESDYARQDSGIYVSVDRSALIHGVRSTAPSQLYWSPTDTGVCIRGFIAHRATVEVSFFTRGDPNSS